MCFSLFAVQTILWNICSLAWMKCSLLSRVACKCISVTSCWVDSFIGSYKGDTKEAGDQVRDLFTHWSFQVNSIMGLFSPWGSYVICNTKPVIYDFIIIAVLYYIILYYTALHSKFPNSFFAHSESLFKIKDFTACHNVHSYIHFKRVIHISIYPEI